MWFKPKGKLCGALGCFLEKQPSDQTENREAAWSSTGFEIMNPKSSFGILSTWRNVHSSLHVDRVELLRRVMSTPVYTSTGWSCHAMLKMPKKIIGNIISKPTKQHEVARHPHGHPRAGDWEGAAL